MQPKTKLGRPTSAFQKQPLPSHNLSKTQAFKPQSAFQNEEFKKQLSKPFSTRKKDPNQTMPESFNQQSTDIQLTDLDSIRSSMQKIEDSQRDRSVLLQAFVDESKNRYDFPENFEEVVYQSTEQVRSKKQVDSDLVSVYSNINGIEMEFKKDAKQVKQDLKRNLDKIKELEEILAQKEAEYQSLLQSRIETEKSEHDESISQIKNTDRSIISDQSSQNNMFLTGVKEEKPRVEKNQKKNNYSNSILEKDNESLKSEKVKQAIVGPNFMEQNKIIQKREDKYILSEEQQQRVEEIMQLKQDNIYHHMKVDEDVEKQLYILNQELVSIYPKEELGVQPKDVFILKQKEQISIQKKAVKLNDQLHTLALKENELESQEAIQNCLSYFKKDMVIKEQPEFNQLLDKFEESVKKIKDIIPEYVEQPPLPPVPDLPPLIQVQYPESIQNRLKDMYLEQKQLLEQEMREINECIERQIEMEKNNELLQQQELEKAHSQDQSFQMQEQEILNFQAQQELDLEELDQIEQRIQVQIEKEYPMPEELRKELKEEDSAVEREYVSEDVFYTPEMAKEELQRMGVNFDGVIEEEKKEQKRVATFGDFHLAGPTVVKKDKEQVNQVPLEEPEVEADEDIQEPIFNKENFQQQIEQDEEINVLNDSLEDN